MIALVTGAASSGKSAYAEDLAMGLAPLRLYLATMYPEGRAAQERIARHRALRAGKGFHTVEACDGFGRALAMPASGVALVEDLGNLVAARLFRPDGTVADAEDAAAGALADLRSVCAHFDHVVVVGNEVGADGLGHGRLTDRYVRVLGRVACSFAARCDTVVEVVCGVPNVAKGEERGGGVAAWTC